MDEKVQKIMKCCKCTLVSSMNKCKQQVKQRKQTLTAQKLSFYTTQNAGQPHTVFLHLHYSYFLKFECTQIPTISKFTNNLDTTLLQRVDKIIC